MSMIQIQRIHDNRCVFFSVFLIYFICIYYSHQGKSRFFFLPINKKCVYESNVSRPCVYL